MADHAPFDPQQLQILLLLVGDRSAEEVLKHEPDPVREQLRAIEKKLKAQLAEPDIRTAIAEDIRLGRRSSDIRDEIIAKVGMLAAARTPEMQARYDAAVERESRGPGGINLVVTITGPQAQATVVARAVVEMLGEANISASMPEEAVNPYDGDSIEQLGSHRNGLRDRCVIVQTSGARGAHCTCGEEDGSEPALPHKTWCPKTQENGMR